jgi:hypothetical protein
MMPKFYVESGPVRLVVSAETAEQAAVRAFQRSQQRQAEIYATPPSDVLRDAEAVQWQLDAEIVVSEAGFARPDAEAFDTLEIAALWQTHVFADGRSQRVAITCA